jgi:hypothetical protein
MAERANGIREVVGSTPIGSTLRKSARVVESGSLENCYTRKGIGGSNPPSSAE